VATADVALSPTDGAINITSEPLYEGTISPMIYGEFVEFLNDMIPGMWAEKIEDRSFEGILQPGCIYPPGTNWVYPRWRPFTCALPDSKGRWFQQDTNLEPLPEIAAFELDTADPFAGKQSAKVTVGPGDGRPCFAGIEQPGIAVKAGQRLAFEMYVRSDVSDSSDRSDKGPIRVRLGRNYGVLYEVYGEAVFATVPAGWTKLGAEFVSPVTDDNAVLSIGIERPGTFWLDKVSLIPDDNMLGWRPDVVKAIRDMKPGIIRFGGSSLIFYDWKTGLGQREKRAAFVNEPWGNMEEHDVGLLEFLEFCELVGAEPLICTNSNSTDTESVLDEIEFCNRPADSMYGKIRAAMGHPKPFAVKYWQIGNEQAGEEYEKRLIADCRAIRAKYPDLVLMASFPSDNIIDNLSDALDYVCPHFYEPYTREVEAGYRELIDRIRTRAKNRDLKLGITEWNITAGAWGWGRSWLLTQYCALNAGRVFQMYQRLGDVIRIANRSNMTNSCCSGTLQTNKSGIYFTPTYYVQKAFSNLSGDIALRIEASDDETLDIAATRRGTDGEIAVSVVNMGDALQKRTIDLSQCGISSGDVNVWTLAAPSIADVNSWVEKTRVVPIESKATTDGTHLDYTFPPHSVTILRFR
jgi:alpha-L-arabinofuranosidase